MKYRSVFDIIGPVMIGPSSSHTAGAARMGQVARQLFRHEPERVSISLYGSFA
ncbi:serine dehydratase beta chain, partial [Bacillus paranthracis]